jgi:hypothetical protein
MWVVTLDDQDKLGYGGDYTLPLGWKKKTSDIFDEFGSCLD